MDDAALVRVLKALADPNRFRMVQEIAAAGEISYGEVGARFALAQPTISHHLKILTDAQLLVVRRSGKHGFVSVNRALLDEVAAVLPARFGSPPRRQGRKRTRTPGSR